MLPLMLWNRSTSPDRLNRNWDQLKINTQTLISSGRLTRYRVSDEGFH